MPSYQTNANSNAFVFGSARMYVPSSSGGYVNLGSAKGVKITESWEEYEVEPDNTPTVIVGIKNQTVTVEGNLLELNLQKIARMRSGLDTFSTTTFTFDTGGNLTVTPQAFYLVNTSASSSQSITATIYWASIAEGLQIPFPSDHKTEVAEIPFKLKGVCQSTRTAGQQLYSIVDLRSNIYSTAYTYASTDMTV